MGRKTLSSCVLVYMCDPLLLHTEPATTLVYTATILEGKNTDGSDTKEPATKLDQTVLCYVCGVGFKGNDRTVADCEAVQKHGDQMHRSGKM